MRTYRALSGLAAIIGLTAISLVPAFALDVLVNQVGYEPEGPKAVRVQRSTDFAGAGSFSVKRSSDNAIVYSGALTRKGGLWDKFYWEGDFSLFRTAGDYYISATVDTESADSYGFSISPGTVLAQTGVLTYQYFWTQRCGCNVPGWHGPCHLDDGLRSDTSVHVDAFGGWHDAGDYGKYAHGFAGDGVFGLLTLYDSNRSHFDSIDVIDSNGQNGSNGIADILDEATYQARWLAKMVLPSGHVMQQTRMRRTGATWVRPELDTNNSIGDWDDRWIDPGGEVTPQETVCCASLIRMHRVLASKGLPTENFASKASSIWDHRVALAESEGGHNNLGNGALHIFAGVDLYAVFGQQNCWDRTLQRVAEMASGAIGNPACYDTSAETAGYELGAMAWFARNYPNEYCSQAARDAVPALMSHYMSLADNPTRLIKRYLHGEYTFFDSNSNWDAFYLGFNRCYLLCTWGAMEAYRLLHEPAYVRFAVDQYDWVMGTNYNRVCMMEAAGDWNVPRYHTRYDKLPGHSDGAQPGCVPNGYVQYYSTDLPYMDLSTNRYQTNEGWLINNAAYAMALSQMHDLDEVAPGPVTGFSAVGGDGQITLSWTNPADADFASTVIRYSTSGYPDGPGDGALVVDKANSPGSSDSFVHTGLPNETTCYYSAFSKDAVPNHSAAATMSAATTEPICFEDQFTYSNGNLNGNGGWSGSATSEIAVLSSAVRIAGGADNKEAVRTFSCSHPVMRARVKIKAGSGVGTLWGVWFDDPAGNNLARWYGSGTTARPRIGATGLVLPPVNLTGSWDELEVYINTAADASDFYFNGTFLGSLSHSSVGAGNSIGRVIVERIYNSGPTDFVDVDSIVVGQAPTDVVPPGPVSSFSAVGADAQVTLSWTNPSVSDFSATMIRSSTTGYPTSITDGSLVANKPNAPGSSDSTVHAGLVNGRTYYYSAFARDSASNSSSAANANATAIGEICLEDHFSYPNSNLNGNGGWSGSAASQIAVANSAVTILGGAGSYDALQAMNCAALEGGVLGVHIRAMKGTGTNALWNLWIDDAAGQNFGRWFGTGSVVRGRIGTGSQLTASQNLTGGWDDLYVKITPATNQTQFIFNGSVIGTYNHTETSAGDAIGRIRIERIDQATAAGQYVNLDDLRTGFADTTSPSATVGPPSALLTRLGPVNYTANISEPVYGLNSSTDIQINAAGNAAAGATAVTGSGSGPYSIALSSISGGGTLGITVKSGACSDIAGNLSTASAPGQAFTVLAEDGSIGSALAASNGAEISLANKSLYYLSTGVGYIEEPGRWSGIRIEGSIPASEGQNVLLTGTRLTTAEAEPYVLVSLLQADGEGPVEPLAANNAALKQSLAGGLYVRAWGFVKAGSVTDSSYVLCDGSDTNGIKVMTPGAPGVVGGQFVVVDGPAAWDGHRVIYSQ